MKVPKKLHDKRVKQTHEMYNIIFDNKTFYDEKVYQIINILKNIQDEKFLKKNEKIISSFISKLKLLSNKDKNQLKNIKDKKIQIRQITKNLILESLSETMAYTINTVKNNYFNFYNEKANTILKVKALLYVEDGKDFDERIEVWFKLETDIDKLQNRISLIHETETIHIIPQVVKLKLKPYKKNIYV